MKNIFVRVFACMLFMACILSLAACSSEKKPESSGSSTGSAVSSGAGSSEGASSESPAGERTETGKYATVKDFVNSDLMQSQLETMKAQLGSGGADVDITGEESKLIFTFRYSLGDQEPEAVSAILESSMASMEKNFEGLANSLKDAVEVENPTVAIICVAEDGTELYSKEFTGK